MTINIILHTAKRRLIFKASILNFYKKKSFEQVLQCLLFAALSLSERELKLISDRERGEWNVLSQVHILGACVCQVWQLAFRGRVEGFWSTCLLRVLYYTVEFGIQIVISI